MGAFGSEYTVAEGYPDPAIVQQTFDEADLMRAVHAYRFFYPTVSLEATWRGNLAGGVVPNETFGLLEGTPKQFVFTPNSDTPYAGLTIDTSQGPMVVEVPPGLIMGTVNDLNQLWVMDIGLPGPAKAAGGTHLIVPPGYTGEVPDGYFVGEPTTHRVLVLVRALPQGKDMEGAVELIKQVNVRPLHPRQNWTQPGWADLSKIEDADFTPVRWEKGIEFWQVLAETLQADPPNPEYRYEYGELAELGIEHGRAFAPDERLRRILTSASETGHRQMQAQSFADRRPDRIVWENSNWEWAVLRPENGNFATANTVDLYAREKWFYQAQIESPAMFAREPGAGSLYWLGLRDGAGDYLDGSETYTLTVPQPVPANLFWSVTVYDARTRSEIRTEQSGAALRSLFELADVDTSAPLALHFGPDRPADEETASHWLQTIPGVGWFVYFRIYGPGAPAFDGSWRLDDFQKINRNI